MRSSERACRPASGDRYRRVFDFLRAEAALVLTSVVAHEVAHLVKMNHGPAFWATVERLVGDPRPARDWPKRHWPGLHRISFP
ncbi:YgjP-like metallopeptidase domain-containing protein [Magnetospirillum molischianum]|uniref:YgjP-like metallopeptidase domain-containing protein n=1 Tax=Magnetospirillum molischianum DSM 120 TaxID=1150626 RepID=H8FQS2_MAGML|nr:YgjP-like metallopeptidase domain-containing protein [Magnetospirillum molischianum]CCG40710.1 hypothetical protein PHAMO_210221 [Magnetospirillum molischianum DSM 120]